VFVVRTPAVKRFVEIPDIDDPVAVLGELRKWKDQGWHEELYMSFWVLYGC